MFDVFNFESKGPEAVYQDNKANYNAWLCLIGQYHYYSCENTVAITSVNKLGSPAVVEVSMAVLISSTTNKSVKNLFELFTHDERRACEKAFSRVTDPDSPVAQTHDLQIVLIKQGYIEGGESTSVYCGLYLVSKRKGFNKYGGISPQAVINDEILNADLTYRIMGRTIHDGVRVKRVDKKFGPGYIPDPIACTSNLQMATYFNTLYLACSKLDKAVIRFYQDVFNDKITLDFLNQVLYRTLELCVSQSGVVKTEVDMSEAAFPALFTNLTYGISISFLSDYDEIPVTLKVKIHNYDNPLEDTEIVEIDLVDVTGLRMSRF